MKIDTHVYLVSAQATPNITPALDIAIRPKEVILLVSKDMSTHADWLESVLKSAAGVKVSRWSIDHPWDVEHVQERLLELLDNYDGQSIALNATGGTKPMSIAAYGVFRDLGNPVFYVHPERDQILWMHPSGQARHQLADRIRITHFLEAHGSKVIRRAKPNVPTSYKDLALDLIKEIDYFSQALGVLNYYANTAERTLRSVRLDNDHLRFDAFQDLLDRLEMIQVLKVHNEQLHFTNEEARFFANGGWLEQYVLSTLNSLKKDIPEIQDTAMSLEVERGNGVRNEIDVAFLVDNKLHLIECKAKNFTKPGDSSGANAIYKLDSITDGLGGIKARSLLISYKPLRNADRERASNVEVQILQARQLRSLKSHLIQWIKKV